MKRYDKIPRKTTVYSAGEEAFMTITQAWREHIFRPLLELLNACRVTPNQLTYLSLLCGVVFCVFFSLNTQVSQLVAFVMLGPHVLLDGIDGPLARYTGTASNQGSFTDSMSDQLVVAFSTITLIHSGHIGIVPGGLYVFFYTLVVVFAMIRNSLAIPYSWLVRPRFFVYVWMLIEVYWLPGTINYVLWGFTGLLVIKMFSGFVKIRRKL
jgi:phosphatidylglycerophosphate synthase